MSFCTEEQKKKKKKKMRKAGAGRVRNVQQYANVVSHDNMVATNEKQRFSKEHKFDQ